MTISLEFSWEPESLFTVGLDWIIYYTDFTDFTGLIILVRCTHDVSSKV